MALMAYAIRGLLRPKYGYMRAPSLLAAFARPYSDCKRYVPSKGVQSQSRDCRHRLPVVPDVTVRLSREEVVTQVSDYRCHIMRFSCSVRLSMVTVIREFSVD